MAIGQTSWGPTGFCAVQGVELAERLKQQVENDYAYCENLSVLIASARNSGGEVIVERTLVR